MGRLDNKVALVTGAAGGMGAAMVRLFASEGASVVAVDLPNTGGADVVKDVVEAGNTAIFTPADLADEGQVEQAAHAVRDAYGALHAIVNVAGINHKSTIEDMDTAAWDRMMTVNVRGMVLIMKHCVPLMRESGGGAIVNMASVSAHIGTTAYSAYHTTKGAVLGLTRAVAQEFAPYNIRVNALSPGWVDTPFTDRALALEPNGEEIRAGAGSQHLVGRMATPEEVARAAMFLISDDASFVAGTELFVDGGFMVKR